MKKEELSEKLKQEGVFDPAEGCAVALSGGCDSVSLLLLLKEWQNEAGFPLWAVHVNHGLRENAAEDERFCIGLCAKLSVPLVVFREDVRKTAEKTGQSQEEAGRSLRYERLIQTAEKLGLTQVTTAHQQNDQAETLLLNLLRGSGLHGLSGIRPVRALNDTIRLVRPLLGIRRKDLEEFLKEEGQSWREDESNREEIFTRNYIRNRLLPAMEPIRNDPARALAGTARRLTEVSRFLSYTARRYAEESKIDLNETYTLPLTFLDKADPVLRTEIFRIWLDTHGGLKDLGEPHFTALNELLSKTSGSSASLPNGRRVLREQEDLKLEGGPSSVHFHDPRFRIETFSWKDGMKIPDCLYTKWIDHAIINDHLSLRNRRQGDYLFLADGGKKSLSRFMVDEKIPLEERDRIWVLAQGSHVLWVVGYRLSAAARITDKTTTVAQITVEEAGDEKWKNM